jgi:hypothetical protein
VSDAFTCGLEFSGAVRCWGNNEAGQLGDGTRRAKRLRPVTVKGLPEVTMISASRTGRPLACALAVDGAVWCWGSDEAGEFAGQAGDAMTRPRRVPGVADATSVDVGATGLCAVLRGGGVTCLGPSFGLWSGGRSLQSDPWRVSGASRSVAVTVGTGSICTRTTNGQAVCWEDPRGAGRRVPGVNGALEVSTDGEDSGDTCALTADRRIRCWGSNALGVIGDGTKRTDHRSVVLPGVSDASALAVGVGFGCAVVRETTIWCWGDQYGSAPRRLGEQEGTVELGAGGGTVCARSRAGAVTCWGGQAEPSLSQPASTARTAAATVRCPFVASGPCTGRVLARLALRPGGVGPHDREADRGPRVGEVTFAVAPGAAEPVRLSLRRAVREHLLRTGRAVIVIETRVRGRLTDARDVILRGRDDRRPRP